MVRRHFCTRCQTTQPTMDYRCAICGTPVRLHPLRLVASAYADRGLADLQLGLPGWHGITADRHERQAKAA